MLFLFFLGGKSFLLEKILVILLCGVGDAFLKSVLDNDTIARKVLFKEVFNRKAVCKSVVCNYCKLTVSVVEYPVKVVLVADDLGLKKLCCYFRRLSVGFSKKNLVIARFRGTCLLM